jgi:GT2 family glycosyltransferase
VSVVIPAHGGQHRLDLTLAALSEQTYPGSLTEVVVVDDGSEPALRLPEIRPENTRIILSPPDGRGAGHAMNAGIEVAEGEIIQRLDADMVICREHLEALMRWQHLTDYLVTIGGKKFTPEPDLTAGQVRDAVRDGELETLFDPSELVSSSTEETIRRLDGLRSSKNPYQVCTGPTVSVRRALLNEVRGFDAKVIRGQDTEFAYRLAQAGVVFIPDAEARAVHLGLPAQRGEHRESIVRLVETHLAQKVPLRRDLRKERARRWLVPYVEIVLDVTGAGEREARASVVAALGGTLPDVVVTLPGPWSGLRHTAPGDPSFELALLRDGFAHDPRVRLTGEAAPTAAPAPFRFTCPLDLHLAPDSLERMTKAMTEERLGVLVVTFPDGRTARLERTEAVARARLLLGLGDNAGDHDSGRHSDGDMAIDGAADVDDVADAGDVDVAGTVDGVADADHVGVVGDADGVAEIVRVIDETHGVRYALAKEFWPETSAPERTIPRDDRPESPKPAMQSSDRPEPQPKSQPESQPAPSPADQSGARKSTPAPSVRGRLGGMFRRS